MQFTYAAFFFFFVIKDYLKLLVFNSMSFAALKLLEMSVFYILNDGIQDKFTLLRKTKLKF